MDHLLSMEKEWTKNSRCVIYKTYIINLDFIRDVSNVCLFSFERIVFS